MIVLTFSDNTSTTIISCYSTTDANNETDLITFYNELFSLVRIIPKDNVLIIDGDMDAQIGKDENNKFCIYKLLNRNGKHLREFLQENRLTCLYSKF